jgi:hypothetical protein
MIINIPTFTGMVPKEDSEHLPDNASQRNINCNFNSGAVFGIQEPVVYTGYTHPAAIKSGAVFVYDSGSRGYVWSVDVDAVRSPAQADIHRRFYWTSDTEFRFALATEAAGYVGAPGTSYKVGTIDSSKWPNRDMAELGVTLETTARGIPETIGAISTTAIKYWLAKVDGTRVAQLTAPTVTPVGTAVNGWQPSYNLAFASSLDSYGQATASSVTYNKVDRKVMVQYYGTYNARLWFNASNNTLTYMELMDFSGTLPTSVTVDTTQCDVQIYDEAGSNISATVKLYARSATNPARFSLTAVGIYPAELYVSNTGASTSGKMQLCIQWDFVYNGQAYSEYYYEDANLSTSLDIAGGMRASIIRNSGTSFSWSSDFYTDQPLEYRAYIITVVNALGEESAPSKPIEIKLNPGRERIAVKLNLTTMSAFVTSSQMLVDRYGIHGLRLYRTANTSTGSTDFMYAFTLKADAEPALAGDIYLSHTNSGSVYTILDTVTPEGLGAPCPTQDFITNTSDLQKLRGLTAIHGGMTAAFKENEVWVSEPYMPWAYKPASIYTLDHKPVRIVAQDQGFAVLTDGNPYFFSGQTPDTLIPNKSQSNFASLTKRAACAVGNSVFYISGEGPVQMTGTNAELIPSFSREAFRTTYAAFKAAGGTDLGVAAWGNRLIIHYNNKIDATNYGYLFDTEDKTWTYLKQKIAYTLVAPAGSMGNTTPELLYVDGAAQQWSFFAMGSQGSWEWWSKDFRFTKAEGFGWLQITGKGEVRAEVLANDTMFAYTPPTATPVAPTEYVDLSTATRGMAIWRLPATKDYKWCVRLYGKAGSKVTGLALASSTQELKSV